jgi:hypothetical protein
VATRSWMFICVVILAIAMFFTRESARGQGPTFDRAMVLEAMKLSGRQNDIGELPDTVTRVYVATIKSQHRGMSEQELDEISKSVEAYVSAKAKESDLEGQLVAIYERHLTPEDVAQLAAFLRSESGKRYMTAMPVILEESGDLGKRWVESINPGIQAEVSKYLH